MPLRSVLKRSPEWIPATHGASPALSFVVSGTLTLLFASCLVFALPGPLFAHGALRSATPRDGEQLAVAPRELRLTFTEKAEPALSRLRLTGPGGPVAVGPLTVSADSATVLIGAIEGPLVAGSYTVNWQAVGPDGHPVRGEYSFVVLPGAQGVATALNGAPPEPVGAAPVIDAEAASAGVSVWVWFLALVVLAALGWFVLRLFNHRRGPRDEGLT